MRSASPASGSTRSLTDATVSTESSAHPLARQGSSLGPRAPSLVGYRLPVGKGADQEAGKLRLLFNQRNNGRQSSRSCATDTGPISDSPTPRSAARM